MKKVIATVLSVALLGASVSTAFADNHRRHNDRSKDQEIERIEKKARDDKKKKEKQAIAAGVLGLAAGAIIGGAMINNNTPSAAPVVPVYPQPTYPPHRPGFDRYEHHRPHYRDTRYYNPRKWGEPFSPEWYRYCAGEYRSFDPKTGTYRARNGRVQFCEIPAHVRANRR